MFLGHAALGFAAKRATPKTSLAALVTAPFLADLLWPVFVLMGWEHVRIAPGVTAVAPFDFVSYPFSHSLLMLAVWGGLFGGLWFALTRDGRAAWWLAALVVSHWVLDAASHRPDMPLWPGGPVVGLGLWYSLPGTIAVELGMLGAGLWIYLRTTRARNWAGHVSLWLLILLLLFAYFGSVFGPPPPDAHTLVVSGLVGWIFIPWAWWIDRTRVVRDHT